MGDSSSGSVASLGDIIEEPAARSRADQVLRSILLTSGLLEDLETGTATLQSGAAATLRGMRQRGPLSEIRGDVQTVLLGGILYEYSDGVSATRAADARQLAVGRATPRTSEAAPETPRYPETGLARLRRSLERLLQEGSTHGSIVNESQATARSRDIASLDSSIQSPASSRLPGLTQDEQDLFQMLQLQHDGRRMDSSLGASSIHDDAGASSDSSSSSSRALDHSDAYHPGMGTSMVDSELLVGLGGTTAESSRNSQADNADESVTGFLRRLAAEDESLVRSWLASDEDGLLASSRRVLQMGAVLAGALLSEAEIRALPRVRFEEAEEQQCSICLEAFRSGEFLTELPCAHFFHVNCVAQWFQGSAQCPLCRSSCRLEDM